MPLHVAVVCAASIRRALGSQRIEKATDLLLRRIPHLHGRRGATLVRFVVDDRRIQFVVLVVHGSSGAWFSVSGNLVRTRAMRLIAVGRTRPLYRWPGGIA